MTGGIADTEEDSFVFRSLGIPVHWVMCMLEKIREFFFSQSIDLYIPVAAQDT
jgi:hypothetical protein